MKTKLFLLSLLLISFEAISQIMANQPFDFEDGTTQNWIIGNANNAPFPPMNVATGGPNGVDDNFLEYTSTGITNEPGSKMVIFNSTQGSPSNFTSQGIVGIRFDIQVLTNDLNMRIALFGSGTRICTTNAVAVAAGGGWTSITIPVSSSDLEVVIGGNTVENTLTNVSTMRILSSDVPTWDEPDEIIATLRIDNIVALTTLNVNEQNLSNDFKIIQNPSSSKLILSLPNSETNLDVFDVLGKKILTKQLSGFTSSIDVSKWNSGVYLVRVTSNDRIQTKRFVKQ
jgi:hypothetical protein